MLKPVRSNLKRFAANTSGNIAIMVALAAIPLFGAAGAAVDYAGRSQAEAKLQAAIDAGTLAGAAVASDSKAEIRNAVRRFAETNGSAHYMADGSKVKVQITNDGTIRVSAEADYPTSLMRIVGFNSLPMKAYAESKRSEFGAEIALVLDVTGSMGGSKIDALKAAARDFVTETTKPNDKKPDSVKLSIVPYNQYVNVGMGNRNASWMDVPADYSTTENVCQNWTTSSNPHNCRTESYSYYNDGVQMSGTREVCDYDTNTVNECRPVTHNYTWRGCAGSRDYPWNVRDERPGLDIPGLLNTWCPNEITPLTSNVATLNGNIDALSAWGNTYIPAGLIWGWRTLSSEVPYTEGLTSGAAQAKGVTKHIVLMTDGENVTSKSPTSANHDGWDPDAGDATTAELCDNVKSAGIIVHAIAFDVSDASTKSMLQTCASPGNYYDAGDATALAQAFDTIAGNIQKVALSK